MTTPTAPVYIVDDDASVRDAVGRLVRSGGWQVETFASAHEFLASPWASVPSWATRRSPVVKSRLLSRNMSSTRLVRASPAAVRRVLGMCHHKTILTS